MVEYKNLDRLEDKVINFFKIGYLVLLAAPTSLGGMLVYQDMTSKGYESFIQYFNEVIVPGLGHLNEALYLGL